MSRFNCVPLDSQRDDDDLRNYHLLKCAGCNENIRQDIQEQFAKQFVVEKEYGNHMSVSYSLPKMRNYEPKVLRVEDMMTDDIFLVHNGCVESLKTQLWSYEQQNSKKASFKPGDAIFTNHYKNPVFAYKISIYNSSRTRSGTFYPRVVSVTVPNYSYGFVIDEPVPAETKFCDTMTVFPAIHGDARIAIFSNYITLA